MLLPNTEVRNVIVIVIVIVIEPKTVLIIYLKNNFPSYFFANIFYHSFINKRYSISNKLNVCPFSRGTLVFFAGAVFFDDVN